MVTDEACSTVEQIFVPQLYFGQGNLYVPNTITPSNEDNLNDYFQLYYHGDVDFEKVLIYNRWGTLVFTSTDIHFKWNGSVNGEILYNNVYTYLLYYHDHRGTEHVIKGFLLVL
jgi:gliding motility-associated-like protein